MPLPLKIQVESGNVFWGCAENLKIVYRSAEIKNVVAKQRYPWNGRVDISFDVEGNPSAGLPEDNQLTLSIVATNRVTGESWTANNLEGDTGIAEGKHNVVWDMKAQGIIVNSTNIQFVVTYSSVGMLALLMEGLSAAYFFDGDIWDSSENGLDLSSNGGCFTADRNGIANRAYSFKGQSECLTVSHTAISQTFSFAFWFKTSTTLANAGAAGSGSQTGWYGNYALFPQNGFSNLGYGIKVGTDGVVVMAHGDGYLKSHLSYISNIGSGWNHVAVTLGTDGSLSIYLNGTLVQTGTHSSSRAPQFSIHPGGDEYGYYTGAIDDLMIFNRALSADEVFLLYIKN